MNNIYGKVVSDGVLSGRVSLGKAWYGFQFWSGWVVCDMAWLGMAW